MKALLLHSDRDFDLMQEAPSHAADLTQDLALDTLFDAMAGGDAFVREVARKVLLAGHRNDIATILHRQQIVRDSLLNPHTVRALYGLAVETIEQRKKSWYGIFSTYPPAVLHGAIDLMQMFVTMLKRLRAIAEAHADRFGSPGFSALFATVQREFDDAYFARVEAHLKDLRFAGGVLMSAALGHGNEGRDYVLHQPPERRERWLAWLPGRRAPSCTFHLAPRDEAGARALGDLRNRGINLVANALAQSADHILSFFDMLRTELAFYVGCLNLRERLAALGVPICLPQPHPAGARKLRFGELRDACLALTMGRTVVSNTLDADGRRVAIITGANQGGKSSFLRALGLAQLMLQAGMFVAAESFAGELAAGLFTHYRREEDATMRMGKFDEELSRISVIVDALVPHAFVLFNESFAATNEREGSEVARQIVTALLDHDVKVFFVTHLYEFARGLFASARPDALFLRAERLGDGTRTFRLVPGEPLATSHGEDLYREIFAAGTQRTERLA
jgi:hypothetical protein